MTQGEQDVPPDATSVFASGLVGAEPDTAAEPDSGEEPMAGVEGLPEGMALLVVKRGPNAGSRYQLAGDVVTAGRHPDSDIFLDDISVSRRHAEFRRVEGGFEVMDVGSLNGTYVNREPVESSHLAGGDEIQIGKFRLVYLTRPGGSDAAAPSGT